MRTILHILTRPEDEVTRKLIDGQRALPDTQVEIVALNQEDVNYDAVVEKTFLADSIEVS